MEGREKRKEGKEIIVKIRLCISKNDRKFQILKIMIACIGGRMIYNLNFFY